MHSKTLHETHMDLVMYNMINVLTFWGLGFTLIFPSFINSPPAVYFLLQEHETQASQTQLTVLNLLLLLLLSLSLNYASRVLTKLCVLKQNLILNKS